MWTVNRIGPIIELIPDGTTDFLWDEYFQEHPDGIHIDSIQVYFSAASDEIEMRTHTAAGPRILKFTTTDGESIAKIFWGAKLKPVIVHAEQVYSTATNWIVTIQEHIE